MASRKDRNRLLVGGMALLPPGDKIAPSDSMVIENFRVDQDNALRSIEGTVLRAGPIGSGVFHTLRRNGNDEYAGIGTALHSGSALENTVDSGYDGQPLGMAFYRGAGWVMNRGKRSRLNGLERNNWGIAAPTTAPSATGGGQLTTGIEEFDGGDLNVGVESEPGEDGAFSSFAMQGGSPVENDLVTAEIQGGIAKSGSALKITALEAVSFSGYANIGINAAVDGQYRDDDIIRVWVWCSNPKAVDAVTVFARSGSGYVEYAFPQSYLNQALNSWTQLKIRRRLNLDDFTQRITDATKMGDQQNISDLEAQFATAIESPAFVYTGSGWPHTGVGAPPPSTYPPSEEMLSMSWAGVSQFGVSVKANAACTVVLDKAEVVGTVGANSSGAIQYYVSFQSQYMEDSNPSPISNAVVAGNQTITLSGIPTSPDPIVRRRLIYRIGGGLSQPLLVGILHDNATSSWEDHTTNAEAQAGIFGTQEPVMPINRTLPPPARGVIGPVFGKLIAFSTAAHPARVFWTPAGVPWCFPGADDEVVGNWEDAGADDDEIIGATDHKPAIVLYKQRSIWILRGDPETNSPTKTNANRGLVGPNALCDAGGLDYFGSDEGIYTFDGDFEREISQAIAPIFKGYHVQLSDGVYLPPVSQSYMHLMAIAKVGDRLRVSYAEEGYTSNNVVAVYHVSTGRWTMERYSNRAASGFTALIDQGTRRGMFAGASGSGGGYYYDLEATYGQGFEEDGFASVVWQSRYLDQGLPDNDKVYTDLEFDFQSADENNEPSVLTVFAIYNNGTKVQVGTIQTTDLAKPRETVILRIMNEAGTEIGRTAKNVSIRIEGEMRGLIVIYGVYLHWYPEERQARSFDTGLTDLGMPERVKEIDHHEFVMTSEGQGLRRVFSSDLPGSILVHRSDQAITSPSGRGTYRQRLSTNVEGRNFRLTLSDEPSGGIFQLHSCRVRMRPIGEYIDGTIGEYYESPEFSVEPHRAGELKDFLLDYDTPAPGLLVLYSDLPGTALAIRRQMEIPARTTRGVFTFPFEIPTITAPYNFRTALPYGQLFKVRLYPASGVVLRLHGRAQFRGRLLGVYFDGSAGEIWETQPLDLLGGMGVFREVEVNLQSAGPMWLEILTEVPEQNIRVTTRVLCDPTPTTDGRLLIRHRLPGNTKGTMQQFRLIGPHVTRLFGVRILGRRTQGSDTNWGWITVPMERTSDEWANINMPVRETPEGFAWVEIPVDAIE